MDWAILLATAVGATGAYSASKSVLEETCRSPASSGGRTALRGNRPILYLCVFMTVAGPSVLFIAARSADVDSRWAAVAAALGLAGITIFGLLGVVWAIRTRVECDDTGVRSRTFANHHHEAPWSDITAVRLARRTWALLLTTSAGDTIRVSLMLRGAKWFLDELESRLPSSVVGATLDQVRAAYAGFRSVSSRS